MSKLKSKQRFLTSRLRWR